MDTDNFIVFRKIEDICSDIVKDVETRFDASNYELERPFPKRKIKEKKEIGLTKDEFDH